MPNLDDIIWAAIASRDPIILREALSGNQAYLDVIGNEGFLETLRYHPKDLDVNEIRNILVKFLNKWGCMLRNYDTVTASNLKDCIVDIHSDLLAIQNYSILDFDFEITENRDRIEHIFNSFWFYRSRIVKNFGPTATSKTLHIINHDLFIMWDDAIRLHYWTQNNDIIDSGEGYCFFLIEIKRIAEGLVTECRERFNVADPALWLSERLNIDPPHSLVKFIDEFNWLAYKRRLTRPSDWDKAAGQGGIEKSILDSSIRKDKSNRTYRSPGLAMKGGEVEITESQKGVPVLDTKAYIQRLIQKHEYRRSPKGEESLTNTQHNLYDVIKDIAESSGKRVVLRKDIQLTYKRRFNEELNLLPTDFCYNSVNVGPDFETKFLLKRNRGEFEFVGFHWPASDRQLEIEWSPTGRDCPEELKGKTFIVGIYHRGTYFWDFPRDHI